MIDLSFSVAIAPPAAAKRHIAPTITFCNASALRHPPIMWLKMNAVPARLDGLLFGCSAALPAIAPDETVCELQIFGHAARGVEQIKLSVSVRLLPLTQCY